MIENAAHDRERRFDLGYERKGKLRGQPIRDINTPNAFLWRLKGLGFHYCSLRHSKVHQCSGPLVVDHDHICLAGHSANNACPQCVRGLLCGWGNLSMAVWDEEYRARGEMYLPPEIADYIASRPLIQEPSSDYLSLAPIPLLA